MKYAISTSLLSKERAVSVNASMHAQNEVLKQCIRTLTDVRVDVQGKRSGLKTDKEPYDGFLPFNDTENVLKYFTRQLSDTDGAVEERIVALTKYVLTRVPWNDKKFVSTMISLLFTMEYRREVDFPGHALS